MQVELINALQLILLIAVVLCAACHMVYLLKYNSFLPSKVVAYSEVMLGLAYSKKLTVIDCDTYHKFEIWRYYLFS